MALFEIHQRFKGHFLKELRVSFNSNYISDADCLIMKGCIAFEKYNYVTVITVFVL